MKEEVPTFAAVNMPLTAKAGESMAGMVEGFGAAKRVAVAGKDGGEEASVVEKGGDGVWDCRDKDGWEEVNSGEWSKTLSRETYINLG